MALPKIDLPIFEATLPSNGKKIKYRTFTVKEEKILLVAQESGDPSQNIMALKQVINNCLIDEDIDKLAMFDMEYMMLSIRAKSVDNGISFGIIDPDTGEKIQLELDLDNVTVKRSENHTNQAKINEDYSLFLKYPTIDEFIKIATMDPTDPLVNYVIMVSCLDYVASEDEVHHFKDHTQNEIDAFMDDVGTPVLQGIKDFFDTIPRLKHEIPYKDNTGKEKTFTVEGIHSFFS